MSPGSAAASTSPAARLIYAAPCPSPGPAPHRAPAQRFRCFFDPAGRAFHSVVVLGKEVCGYPSTVHGGLTAAIIDETLGGLYTALLTSGGLGLRMPGLTARLEIDYKKRIAAPAVIHVATEVESIEPRKVGARG
jgi:hypothetical protein